MKVSNHLVLGNCSTLSERQQSCHSWEGIDFFWQHLINTDPKEINLFCVFLQELILGKELWLWMAAKLYIAWVWASGGRFGHNPPLSQSSYQFWTSVWYLINPPAVILDKSKCASPHLSPAQYDNFSDFSSIHQTLSPITVLDACTIWYFFQDLGLSFQIN